VLVTPARRVFIDAYLWRFKYPSTARRNNSAIGAPVLCDNFLSRSSNSSGSQTVVRFFMCKQYDVCQRMSMKICVSPLSAALEPKMQSAQLKTDSQNSRRSGHAQADLLIPRAVPISSPPSPLGVGKEVPQGVRLREYGCENFLGISDCPTGQPVGIEWTTRLHVPAVKLFSCFEKLIAHPQTDQASSVPLNSFYFMQVTSTLHPTSLGLESAPTSLSL